MSENVVEKNFLYLLLLSVLVHVTVAVVLMNLPEEKPPVKSEPLMVDLEGIPLLPPPKEPAPPVKRHAEVQRRVKREVAPKGDSLREKPAPQLHGAPPPVSSPKSALRPQPNSSQPVSESSPRDELFRKRGSTPLPDTAALYPGSAKMARLEESYRKKYGPEVAEGDTRFLNTDKNLLASFSRRLEAAVYGVWSPSEAAMRGVEGITVVRTLFNRRGEIIEIELLESSGSKILDDEALRALKQIGPVGSLPKGYNKETLSWICAFFYDNLQWTMRSLR